LGDTDGYPQARHQHGVSFRDLARSQTSGSAPPSIMAIVIIAISIIAIEMIAIYNITTIIIYNGHNKLAV
jgi:hypothetical protein